MAEKRVIAHLDMDAFYVAVELLRHPELRGKPVVVAGSGPRAVVTTASYEARQFGVGSAMPASLARRRCPEAIFVPPDHAYYRATSEEVREVVAELGRPGEWVSLDEVYLDLTGEPYPIDVTSSLVREIRERLTLDASVGIGPNKLVAKVASDAEKPRGFVVLTREQAAERFAGESPRLLPGIGPKTAERLAGYGVKTIGILQRCTLPGLAERFGERQGRYLHDLAHFRHDSPVTTDRTAKSRSIESTFDTDITDLPELERILREQSERLAAALAKRGIRGRTVAIKVRQDDFSTLTRARTIAEHTNDAATMAAVAVELLRENRPDRPVRLLGVRMASFDDEGAGVEADPPAAEGPQTTLAVG
ncbi:MAG: DNA polymerase IV [Solirubrobacterales bacterium]